MNALYSSRSRLDRLWLVLCTDMHWRARVLLMMAVVGVSGCAGQQVKVESIEDSLHLAALSVRALIQEVAFSHSAKRITTAQKDQLADVLGQAQSTLRAATAAAKIGDTSTALGQLQVIRSLLQSVEVLLGETRTHSSLSRPSARPALSSWDQLAAIF